MASLFGTDGIRGVYGKGLITPQSFMHWGWVLGMWALHQSGASDQPKCIGVAVDGRGSSDCLQSALIAGITSAGVDVKRLGLLPSPGVSYVTHALKLSLGVMITASHNDHTYNGFKLFSPSGSKCDASQKAWFESTYAMPMECHCNQGQVIDVAKTAMTVYEQYIQSCIRSMQGLSHLSSLKQVVLDCANGAMSLIAPKVWEGTGVSLICLNQQAPEKKINQECGSLYPETLKQAVLASKACLGIAFDGDGDRLLMVDRHGEVLSGEDLLGLLMPKSQEARQTGIVLTELVNQGFKQYLDNKQYRVKVTPVGDEHVIQAMKSSGAILGGEPNGHLIAFPWMVSSDALINSLLVAIAMSKSGQILAGYQRPWVPTVSQSLSFPLKGVERPDALKSALIQALSEYTGLWSLVRFSGTEPLIRVSLQASPNKMAVLKSASIQAEKLFKTFTDQSVELSQTDA